MEEEKEKQSKNNSFRKWVDLLVLYFTTIKEYEDKIESLRISLNQQNNFSVRALFNHLDKNSKNFISLDDFIKFLQDNSINYDEKHLRQFIHNYDKDNDFCINYQEFKGIVLPLTDDSFKKIEEENEIKEKENEANKLKEIEENKNNEKNEKDNENNENENNEKNENENNDEDNKNEDNKNEDEIKEENNEEKDNEKMKENNEKEKEKEEEKIDPNILSIFGQILTEEMSLAEKNIENAKNCLNSKNFTFYEGFREIADEDKYITEENLNNFLKKNEVDLNEKDMKGLIHRSDADNDGKISFPEFHEIFYPTSLIKYKRSIDDYNKFQKEYDSISKHNNNKGNYTFNNYSPYYPSRNNNYLGNSYNFKSTSYYNPSPNNYKYETYKSPKLRNTPSALNYDYSTYADEDHDLYKTKPKLRNSSVINLKNYPKNEYTTSYTKSCCGCPLNSFIIHYNDCCCCLCCSPCIC